MNCLFCKQDSSGSRSVEHIIPESLGNKDHVLRPGIVCDSCNNYFAIKVEKPLLEQPYFQSVRARNEIHNKKGRSVPEKGMIWHPKGGPVDIYRMPDGLAVDFPNTELVKLVQGQESGKLVIPIYSEPVENNLTLSRFLCKVALEALVHKFIDIEGWESETIYKTELDSLRRFARYGDQKIRLWQYHQKRIYNEDDRFSDANVEGEPYECLHEFQVHLSTERELFFILCIMGIEYAINYASPEIETFQLEIVKNNGRSLLFRNHQKIIKG